MRRPRIEDYDPDAKLPELASPLDGMPVIGKPPQKFKDDFPIPLPEKSVIQEEQAKEEKQNGTPYPHRYPLRRRSNGQSNNDNPLTSMKINING